MLQMVLSLEVYILGPSVQYTLMESSPALHALVLAALIFTAVHLISASSVVLTSLLLCTLGCITLLCPMWLVRIHKFKAKINGPWDQAAPELGSFRVKAAGNDGAGDI
jgi:phosphatidylinositol N-acetylglucosaminyltransferase subunit C